MTFGELRKKVVEARRKLKDFDAKCDELATMFKEAAGPDMEDNWILQSGINQLDRIRDKFEAAVFSFRYFKAERNIKGRDGNK